MIYKFYLLNALLAAAGPGEPTARNKYYNPKGDRTGQVGEPI